MNSQWNKQEMGWEAYHQPPPLQPHSAGLQSSPHAGTPSWPNQIDSEHLLVLGAGSNRPNDFTLC